MLNRYGERTLPCRVPCVTQNDLLYEPFHLTYRIIKKSASRAASNTNTGLFCDLKSDVISFSKLHANVVPRFSPNPN